MVHPDVRRRGVARRLLAAATDYAYGGLRWGEAVGLTRANADVLRSRLIVSTTAVEVHGKVTLGHEPKTKRSRRTTEWAGHNSVAFTLTRYGGLFEDGSEAAGERLDALLGQVQAPSSAAELRRR